METSELLKKVRQIEIRTRGITRQLFSGEYHSAFKGRGMAFSEVREYQEGDEIRTIDWNVTARFGDPYVKVFEEERELSVIIAVDVSASEQFGSAKQSKKDLAIEIAAVLAFSAVSNNDKAGLLLFSDDIELFVPPRKGKSHILRIIREMVEHKPKRNNTNISEALRYLTNAIKKRCIVFVVSDFLDQDIDKALRISSQKHDVVAVHLQDKREYELPKVGLLDVVDPESQQRVVIDTSDSSTRKHWKRWWMRHNGELQETFRKCGIDAIQVDTNRPWTRELMSFFKKREARR